jgi:hypothetical protein
MSFRIYFALVALILSTQVGLAIPKDDCELAVRHLGYPTERYLFVEAGIFSKEQHVFDDVIICSVNSEGRIHSIYRNDVVLAEDGFFGPEALQKRKEIESSSELRLQESFKAFVATNDKITAETEDMLRALRLSSDPLARRTKQPIETTPEPAPQTEMTLEPRLNRAPEAKPERKAEVAWPLTVEKRPPSQTRWTTAERLTIRTCPSKSCGITGWVTEGTRFTIYEERNGWSRISELGSAMCLSGRSEAVDSGNNACTEANGIVQGLVARWVSSEYLSDDKPEAPKAVDGCVDLRLESSDNYRKYASQFCAASAKMIKDGTCSARDFQEWSWSSSPARGPDYYLTYCGGSTVQNRYYLNIRTGAISQ